jgi:hypothetical protein
VAVVVAALWGVYTFIWKDILVPSWAPASLVIEVKPRQVGLPRFSGQVSRLHPNQCKGIGELLLVVDRTEVSDR